MILFCCWVGASSFSPHVEEVLLFQERSGQSLNPWKNLILLVIVLIRL